MSGVLQEFVTRLAYQIDRNSQRQAQASADAVAASVEAAERRSTQATVAGTGKRIIEANREAGVRTRGAAAYIADLKRRQDAAVKAEGASVKAIARRGFEEAKTNAERLRYAKEIERVEEKEARGTQVRAAAISAAFALIAKAVVSTAGAVIERVQVIAQQFDRLYYMSSRVNASATNVRALSYALRQNGVDASSANSSIENFGRALRTNPGRYQWLERLGIQTKDANGKLRDTTDLMQDLGRILAKKPEALQYQFFEEFGLDDNTGRALVAGVSKYTEEYKKKLKDAGLDPDKAAKDGHKLSQTMTSLGESLSIIGDKIASKLFEKRDSPLQNFIGFLDRNGDRIAAVVDKIASVLMELGQALLKILTSPEAEAWFNTLLKGFGQVDEKTGEFTADLDKIKVALGLVAAYFAGSWLKKVLEVFGILGLKWGALLRALGIGGAAVTTAAIGSAIGADVSIPNATKPGVSNHWDDEASGAAGGAGLGGALKRGWNAAKRGVGRLFGGGGAEASEGRGGEGIRRRGRRAAEADKTNYQFTGANADVLRQAAKELGTSPEDLATVISYETGGRFSPSIWGGKGGNYMGLIQFGPNERRDYGAHDKQTFAEQMPAVVRYLKSRGFKPGMGLLDLYSTINAGRPGRYNASDGNGTVRSHVESMRRTHGARARRFLESPKGGPTPQAPGTPAPGAPVPNAPAQDATAQNAPVPPGWGQMPKLELPSDERRAELKKNAEALSARLAPAGPAKMPTHLAQAAASSARVEADRVAQINRSSIHNTHNNNTFSPNIPISSTDPKEAASEIRRALTDMIETTYRNTRATTT